MDIVGVKNLTTWNKLVRSKNSHELQYLQRAKSSAITGNIPTNLFLYFAVLR